MIRRLLILLLACSIGWIAEACDSKPWRSESAIEVESRPDSVYGVVSGPTRPVGFLCEIGRVRVGACDYVFSSGPHGCALTHAGDCRNPAHAHAGVAR